MITVSFVPKIGDAVSADFESGKTVGFYVTCMRARVGNVMPDPQSLAYWIDGKKLERVHQNTIVPIGAGELRMVADAR